MKRALPVAIVVMLVGCATAERPEGIVERWLVALNQGSAGEPERYAANELSEQVLPRWRERDPGELDVIEIGRATEPCRVAGLVVPFRVVRPGGSTLRAVACAEDGAVVQVAMEAFPDPSLRPLPSEGGPAFASVTALTWYLAVAVGAGLLLFSEAVMWLARRRRA